MDEIHYKRLKFLCWHRSTREMDIILGQWFDKCGEQLSPAEMVVLENLLSQNTDDTLYAWISGQVDYPDDARGPLLMRITHDIETRYQKN